MANRARLWRSVKWLAALSAVLVAAFLGWSWWREQQVSEQLAQRRTSLLEIVPAVPEDENGAAAYYAAKRLFEDAAPVLNNPEGDALKALRAATTCPCERDEDDAAPELHPEIRAAVARFMAESEGAYEAVIEAQTFPATQFHDYATVDVIADPAGFTDAFNVPRRSAQYLDLRARWHLLAGNPDEAMRWALRLLKTANAMNNEVSLMGLLMRNAITHAGVGLIQSSLCSGGGVAIPDEMRDELEMLRDRQIVARFLEGEAALITLNYRTLRANNNFLGNLLVVNPGSVESIGDVDDFAAAMAIENAGKRRDRYDAIRNRGRAREGGWFTGLSEITFPAVVRGVESAERALAELAIAETALYLEAYWNENGEFPEALADLVPEYADAVPGDPFLGGELRYEKTPDGYRMSSPGIGGWSNWPPSSRSGFNTVPAGKITWCVTRPSPLK